MQRLKPHAIRRPAWNPEYTTPRADERQVAGTRVAMRVFMAGITTPSPSPTSVLQASTAGKAQPAETTCSQCWVFSRRAVWAARLN